MAPHVLFADPVKAPELEKSKPVLGGTTTQDLRVPVKTVESSDDLSSLSKRDIIIFSGDVLVSCFAESTTSVRRLTLSFFARLRWNDFHAGHWPYPL
jgi:hypothetical protein